MPDDIKCRFSMSGGLPNEADVGRTAETRQSGVEAFIHFQRAGLQWGG